VGPGVKTLLTAPQTMEILRTTVPRLRELCEDVPVGHLAAVTDYGWSVGQQLAHLRSCQDILGGSMLRILREDHPAWKGRSPRSNQDRYMDLAFESNLGVFRTRRAELLETLEPAPSASWDRTATVTDMVGRVFEYSMLYYGDWMARHERAHLGHIGRILRELGVPS
jgi:DinB superfamily